LHIMKFLLCLLIAMAAAPVGARPVFEDSMAQRTLACTPCHGREGRAGPDGYYPRIAGKPAGYLYNQLLNFRDGRRHYGLMARLLDPLSDTYLLEIAEHFASLELPYTAPRPPTVPAAVLERGRVMAHEGDAAKHMPSCAHCHGAALTGVRPNTPGLLGLSRDYLNSQLGAFRTGQRRAHVPDCMAEIARQLEPDDLNAVANWLAAQPLPSPATPAASLPWPPTIACGSALHPAGRQQP
jgi:cytochrome c553